MLIRLAACRVSHGHVPMWQ